MSPGRLLGHWRALDGRAWKGAWTGQIAAQASRRAPLAGELALRISPGLGAILLLRSRDRRRRSVQGRRALGRGDGDGGRRRPLLRFHRLQLRLFQGVDEGHEFVAPHGAGRCDEHAPGCCRLSAEAV